MVEYRAKNRSRNVTLFLDQPINQEQNHENISNKL